jgi:hypothetical protein
LLRKKKLSKPDVSLGKFENNLSQVSEQIIKNRFKNPILPCSDINAFSLAEYKDVKINNMRLVVFSPQFFHNSAKFVENDLTINVIGSAIESGIEVKHFFGNQSDNSPFNLENERFQSFEQLISEFQPHVLAIDSNFSITHQTFNYNNFLNLKNKYGFKVLMFVPDFELRKLNYWIKDLVDLTQYSRPSLRHLISNIPDRKLICFPPCPYKNSEFASNKDREIDIYYSGSDTRHRRLFINAAYEAGLNVDSNFGHKEAGSSPSYLEFMRNMSRAKMTFSNGYISKNNSLVAGRFVESIISNTVCLYEDCPDIRAFFEPYKHFVPVSNIHNFVMQAQFLRKNQNYLDYLSETAFEHFQVNFSARAFWSYVYLKLVKET